ncbi:hypothetical protein [Pseudomonas sp. S9]|uniref:hypothetical protein n=1 Tax=Pseudomonas sp. S9 TaxID=686578 RepID=UPI0002556DC4|nr:hypothetical protein [Pseudomonas sp. S9]
MIETQQYKLKAMAKNYAGGHNWDHLDGDTCSKAAEEIGTLRPANQRLEAQRDAILLQAQCWAGEAKTQQSITREVGDLLGGIPNWGPIADRVAAIVADRQRLEGEVKRLREALERITRVAGTPEYVWNIAKEALSTANGEVTG